MVACVHRPATSNESPENDQSRTSRGASVLASAPRLARSPPGRAYLPTRAIELVSKYVSPNVTRLSSAERGAVFWPAVVARFALMFSAHWNEVFEPCR